ncbi:Pectate lyase superfamily protein [Maioricimonas rarisocia]|uniref:Pectate lyase superfamily protein n=1 Tax=Maioricimonas rarisocia TaxID=2528026 RepID=A0A517Z894_9PLAN|nr:right-handed parallel beta-helix repeat-containing protein [Maioricimonas rarisocia]QDU38698.1 Pectate lyase superfamily protein [Maioricimonas rarisocia]
MHNLKHTTLATAVLLGLTLCGTSNRGLSAAELPGARPVIDAAEYPSLQAAIDAVPAEGGIVQIPAGKFEISEPLRITGEDIHLSGAGSATHIHNTNTDGEPALALVPDGEYDRTATGGNRKMRWRIQISDMRITGNEKSGHGIQALWVNEIFIHGVTVSENGGDGILLDYCYEDPRVCDSLITYNKKVGLNLLGCHDIVVSATHFEENNDALHCIDGYNLCMTGNNLDDHLRHGVVIENTYGSVVSGNMIEECNGAAVILDRDCYGDTISANVIAHNGQGVLLKDAHGCAVSANTFTILKERALYIGPDSGRITVTGNNFSNSYLGDGKVRRAANDFAAGGLVLEGTSDVVVSGNVFSGLTEPAVQHIGDASRRIVFANNVLTDVTSQHDQLEDSVQGQNIAPEAGDSK